MTEDIAYDDIYKRYENAKHLLKEIRTVFTGSFQNVQNVIQQYQNDSNQAFVGELSSVLQTTRSELETLFKSTSDPGLFEPIKLEQQILAYQQEKKQGIEMVKNLQSTIESLQEEKRNWQIRESKGKKLIEQYQVQIENVKNGTYNNNNNEQTKPLINGSTDYNEDTNVEALKAKVSQLLSENHRLSGELSTYRKRLSESGGNVKQLYRKDTQTEWNESDLAAMKEEMRKEMLQQQQEMIDAQFEAQFALRMPSIDPDQLQQQQQQQQQDEQKEEEDGGSGNNLSPEKVDRAFRKDTKTDWDPNDLAELKKNMKAELQQMVTQQKQEIIAKMAERNDAIRDPTEQPTDSTITPHAFNEENREQNTERKEIDNTVDKEEMSEQLQKMVMQQKQAAIEKFVARNDAIRDPKDASSSDLITPHPFNEDNREQIREQKEAEDEQEADDMIAEMVALGKQNLSRRFTRNYDNVTQSTNDISSKIVIAQDDEADFRKHVMAQKKEELYRKTETSLTTTEPQIKPTHKESFKILMNNIGILNPQHVESLWDNIEVKANSDKREEIQVPKHSLTASQVVDREEMENIQFAKELEENELKQQLQEKQKKIDELMKELDSVKQQRLQEEEDLDILETGVETQGNDDNTNDNIDKQTKQQQQQQPIVYVDDNGDNTEYYETPFAPNPNEIELVTTEKPLNEQQGFINFKNEMNNRINTLQQEKIAMKKHYDSEIEKQKQEINILQEEKEYISNSKIKLLLNTSKEIDSLRQLLSDYVTLANKQRNKNGK